MKMYWPSKLTCEQHSDTDKLKGRKGEYLEIRADDNDRKLQKGKGEMTI